MSETTSDASVVPRRRDRRIIPLALGVMTLIAIALGQYLFVRGTANDSRALAQAPRPVTTVVADAALYRNRNRYVGTVDPWVSAKIGPQVVAAYVKDVFVRPGALVKQGELLATLDCRTATASARAVAAQEQAIQQMQHALADEAKHMGNLVGTGYVSQTEAERRRAQSLSEAARQAAARAELAGSQVAVGDCALRAPFAGEIGGRFADPGAFASPGVRLLSLVDRSTVRVAVDVPETDFDAVAPETPVRIHFLSTNRDVDGTIARRSPEADPGTRTIEVEIDLPNPDRTLPINTTAEIWIDIGAPKKASRIPLIAATVRGGKARVFVVEGDTARQRTIPVLGELEGKLYLDPSLAPGSPVVTEGRSGLHDGDKVSAHPLAEKSGEQTPKG